MSADRKAAEPVLTPETLGPFIEDHGGKVIDLDFSGCAGLHGHIADQTDVNLDAPALDHHFVEVTLSGRQGGTAFAEGMVSSSQFSGHPGSVSFLPADRPCELDIRGTGKHLQLLITKDFMVQAKAEMLRGDPDKVDLLGFNTLHCDGIKQIMLRLVDGRPAIDNRLEADMVALDLARGIIRDFTTGHLIEDADVPRLTSSQLIRSMDMIEACISLNTGLDRIAEALGMPLHYFANAFTAATDLRPGDFLRERQVDRATEWLSMLEIESVEEKAFLAQACGFKDFDALEKAFLRQRGVRVAEYERSRL